MNMVMGVAVEIVGMTVVEMREHSNWIAVHIVLGLQEYMTTSRTTVEKHCSHLLDFQNDSDFGTY